MIKGHIITSDRRTFIRLLLEIMSNSDFEILAHSENYVKYFYTSKTGTKTLSDLTLKIV